MSGTSERSNLLALMKQTTSVEDTEFSQDLNSSDEEGIIDNVSERSRGSDTEQELSSNEEDEGSSRSNSDPLQLFYLGRDGVTKWSAQCCSTHGLSTSENKKANMKHVNPPYRDAKTELDCWKLFFKDEMMKEILLHTNAKIRQEQIDKKESTRACLLKETNHEELQALFGLTYIAGLNRSNRQNLGELWRADGTGVDIFRMTMSIRRFYFLQSCLRFDDAVTRDERKGVDNIAPIRAIFGDFVSNCQNVYSPGEYLTMDEKLEAFRGRCPFLQYIPNKPAKYGIKLYALVDAKSFYTVNLEIYAGRQPPGPFQESNRPFDVVDRLVKPISQSNRNVTFDNWFTSIPLVIHLLYNHKLTSTGAIRKCEKEIPPFFLNPQGCKVHRSQFAFQKDMTLVSYRPEQSKVVLVLSSLHHDQSIDGASGEKKIPEIVTFYNSTKFGVDVVQQLCDTCNVARNTKRWPMTVLYAMMNVAALNAVLVFRENNNLNTNIRDFVRKLGLSMVEAHLSTRKDVGNLPRELRKRIHEHTGDTMAYSPAKTPKTYRRCKDCLTVKDRKTKHSCNVCYKPICMEHVIALCHSCMDLDTV